MSVERPRVTPLANDGVLDDALELKRWQQIEEEFSLIDDSDQSTGERK